MELTIKSFEKSSYERKHGTYSGDRYYRTERGDRPEDHSRVFVSVEGEGFWDDFANRTTRPHTAWRPLVLQALQDAGVKFTKIVWSNKAGCKMCPCSPGFYVHGDKGVDYWLTIEANAPQTVDPDTAEFRLLQVANDPTITGIKS